jgi:SAM-dependent methyltransferase
MACGSGFGLEMLGDAGTCPVGVDYDGDALGAVRHRLRAVRLVRADASMLPFPNGSFNAVVSFETLEHVPDAAAMVAELRRVLKPGGPLVLSTPNRSFGPPERHTGNKFHIREFTADEVRDLLQTHFAEVRLFGQRPSAAYRYVPFLMIQAEYSAAALAWKALLRLPYRARNTLAVALSGRPFYPGETDYCFDAEATDNAHALVAVAQ